MANQRNKQSTGSGSNLNLLHIDARRGNSIGQINGVQLRQYIDLLCAEHIPAQDADVAASFLTPAQIGEAIGNSLHLELPPEANEMVIEAMTQNGFKLKFIVNQPGIEPGLYFLLK